MKRLLLTLILAFSFAGMAYADPFLVSGTAYKLDGTDPDTCTCQVSGGPVPVQALACTLNPVTGGESPKCDLSTISVVGTYNIVMSVNRAEKITNTTGGGSFVPASTASSTPFAYTLNGIAIVAPQSILLQVK